MGETSRQLTAHLTRSEREEFEAYSHSLLLDPAGLLALLFAREMRLKRLSQLLEGDDLPPNCKETKVTARIRPEEHAPLKEYVLSQCESVSHAGGVLIRAELDERWLECACSTRFESPRA